MACCGQPAVCSRTTSRKVADRLGVRSSLRFRPPPFFGVSPRRDLPPVPGPLVLAGSSCNQSRTAVRCTAARHDPAWLPPRQRNADDLFPIAADRTLSFVSLLPPGNSPPCMPLSFWRQLQCNCRAIIVASKRGSYFVGVPYRRNYLFGIKIFVPICHRLLGSHQCSGFRRPGYKKMPLLNFEWVKWVRGRVRWIPESRQIFPEFKLCT